MSTMNESVIQYLGSPNAQAQQQVLQYFEQLKTSDTGWQICASTLTGNTHSGNDHVKFFCLQVIEHFIKSKYATASPDEQLKARTFLMTWLEIHCRGTSKSSGYILNKAAQIFSLAFVVDFPSRWPSFIRDLLSSLATGELAVDMYLRILLAIDSEVVDREIAHTPEETQRNTDLKDALRVESVQLMVDSWYQIITTYEQSHAELTCQCLKVIGAYISWIDVNLIANDRFVPVLFRFLNEPLLCECTCDCLHEIILKGMDSIAKIKLIESFWKLLEGTGVMSKQDDEEGDFLSKLSKLVNGIGLQLILCWQRLLKAKDTANSELALKALESKLDTVLQFLGNEDDDVSGGVATLAHDYLTLLKQLLPLSQSRKDFVKKLLYTVIAKLKYDDSYSWEHEGEDEAMFDEYRKELKVILSNIGALDSELLLQTVNEVFSEKLSSLESAPYQDVEVAITLLYHLAEALPVTLGQQFSSDPSKVSSMQGMMRLLVTSNVSCYRHVAVAQQFFETVSRYAKFFNTEPQQLAPVLMAFLDERGLRNPSAHIRSRTAYLFSRFVRDVAKQHLQAYLEEILTRVSDLLVLHSPDNGVKQYLSGDDQLFMYETAGVLVVQSQFQPEKKQELMKQLLAPIVSKFDSLLQGMIAETNEDRQQAFCESLTQATALASRSSKGFSAQQTMKACGCVEAYTETLTVFLQALDTPVHRQTLHAGVRQFLHRLVVCLDDEILPYIPVAMEKLLKNPDAKELHDFIPLINQVVHKFKKRIAPFLQEVFMPVVSTIFRVLGAPVDERDQVALTEKRLLQRGYFTFLGALVNNNVTEVLSNQEASNLHQVLMTIIEGAVELPDPQSQKACFAILKKLVELWGDPNNGLQGFSDFLYKNIVPACFMAPLKPTFDLNDAQTCLALNDCALCLKSIQEKKGDEMILYLQTDYLPSMNLSAEAAQEFCAALKTEPKVFKQYFKSFFVRAKS